MRRFGEQMLVVLSCGILLVGCGIENKRRNIYDLYELHPVGGAPADHDSYYVPPRRPQTLCSTIGDSPSCGF